METFFKCTKSIQTTSVITWPCVAIKKDPFAQKLSKNSQGITSWVSSELAGRCASLPSLIKETRFDINGFEGCKIVNLKWTWKSQSPVFRRRILIWRLCCSSSAPWASAHLKLQQWITDRFVFLIWTSAVDSSSLCKTLKASNAAFGPKAAWIN